MSSIVLSFVGNQDPFSATTNLEGSIVSLITHLLAEGNVIKHVLLLYTKSTSQGAIDTRDWLDSSIGLAANTIELIPLPEAISDDPVNLLLAVESVKELLVKAQALLEPDDRLELNASSGTPSMKSVWGILQAAGYIPHSQIWQIRNPKEVKPGQTHVFATDMGVLRQEFDRTVIQQQLADYNYSGALATIKASNFTTLLLEAMLQYGHSRSAFDFEQACKHIKSYRHQIAPELITDIDELRQNQPEALLRELYYGAEIYLKNKNYCNFLITVGQFQENSLRLLLTRNGLTVSKDYGGWENFWFQVKQIGAGRLLNHLSHEQEQRKYIRTQGELNIPTMLEILKHFNNANIPIDALEQLKAACNQRNAYIHRLEGVANVPEAQSVLDNVKNILRSLIVLPQKNPFDFLNTEIINRLKTPDERGS
jgi:hypothetical protein